MHVCSPNQHLAACHRPSESTYLNRPRTVRADLLAWCIIGGCWMVELDGAGLQSHRNCYCLPLDLRLSLSCLTGCCNEVGGAVGPVAIPTPTEHQDAPNQARLPCAVSACSHVPPTVPPTTPPSKGIRFGGGEATALIAGRCGPWLAGRLTTSPRFPPSTLLSRSLQPLPLARRQIDQPGGPATLTHAADTQKHGH